jgi:sterol O-acyltransferase
MSDTQPAQRPQLQQQDTLDAPQLVGKLGRNSIAELQPNSAPSTFHLSTEENGKPDTPQQNGVGSHDFASRSKSESAAASVDSDDTIEDYDELQLDPDTLIANTRASLDEGCRIKSEDGQGNGTRSSGTTQAGRRRRSIQIKLQKTDRKGQYTLTADDPEISDILQKGIEREKREAKDKSRTRLRDLVFTRQFTTFDRQNPASSESPFFGFFTLFWLSMVIIFVQVSMHNWRTYGSILGSNQVMKLMFSRDVFMLGLTDGIMCAATVEAFLL